MPCDGEHALLEDVEESDELVERVGARVVDARGAPRAMDSRKSLVPVALREGAERGADAVVVPAQIGEASGGQPPGRLDQDVVDGASDRLRVVGQSEGIQIGAIGERRFFTN